MELSPEFTPPPSLSEEVVPGMLLHFLFILSCRVANIRLAIFPQLYANESMSDHVGFARVFIELINENDNRPIFSKPLYNISIPENTAPGTPLLRILVSAVKHPCRVCCDLFLKFRLQYTYFPESSIGFVLPWVYSWLVCEPTVQYTSFN